ncbi:Toll/interleukin-1 receptor domain-containing protein, partial [Tanacetum coccineum]
DISKGKGTRIPSVCQGTSRIEVLLEKTKALIVLDDIVKVGQLDALLGRTTINKESKIIITTHNDIISDWFMSNSKRFQKYTMRLLNDDEALELLSLHAFQSKIPKDGYNELAQQVVRYCDGSPLALEVLGSSLFHINTITSWESELSSYEKSFNDKIHEVLIRSYVSIPSIVEKELFLHIACFFVGKDMNYVVKILKPDYPAESKIETLIKRCFLYVTPDKKLMMHRLLQEMGRYLADRESRTVSERTRVWRNTDSYHMLRRKKSSITIQGIALDIQMLMKEDNIEPSQLKEVIRACCQVTIRLKLTDEEPHTSDVADELDKHTHKVA